MWFDILVEGSRERPDMQDQKGMERSRIMVESIIQHEVEQGRRVVLAGFSQGQFPSYIDVHWLAADLAIFATSQALC